MTPALRRAGSAAAWGAALLVLAGWAAFLRPPSLGGSATYLIVRGSSMVPTYHVGDLLIVRSQSRYAVGDAVAYRVPRGELGAGQVVIHRIIGGDAIHGFSLQGDNNRSTDPWHPTRDDVVGRTWAVLPGWGRAIALLRNPLVLAGLAAAITVSAVLARAPRRSRPAVRELTRTIPGPPPRKERPDHGRQPDDHPLPGRRDHAA